MDCKWIDVTVLILNKESNLALSKSNNCCHTFLGPLLIRFTFPFPPFFSLSFSRWLHNDINRNEMQCKILFIHYLDQQEGILAAVLCYCVLRSIKQFILMPELRDKFWVIPKGSCKCGFPAKDTRGRHTPSNHTCAYFTSEGFIKDKMLLSTALIQ